MRDHESIADASFKCNPKATNNSVESGGCLAALALISAEWIHLLAARFGQTTELNVQFK